jgi:hypothetical protein
MRPGVIFKNGARSIFLASKAEKTNEASSPIIEDFSKRTADQSGCLVLQGGSTTGK